MTQPLTPLDYLKKILTARVYDVAIESPLEPAPAIEGIPVGLLPPVPTSTPASPAAPV